MTNIVKNPTAFIQAFDPTPETDPLDDFQDFLETKTESVTRYAKKENRNDDYLKKQIAEIQELQNIYDKFNGLHLYPIWVQVEAVIHKSKENCDGITIKIPFIQNAKPERFYHLDLRK